MIIWNGWGWVVPVLAFFVALGTELLSEEITGQDRFYQEHPWLIVAAMVAAGSLVGLVALYLHRRPARVVIDKGTGEELTLREKHSFFFVPLRYWAALLPAIAVVMVLVR
jgi:hypothetical protein